MRILHVFRSPVGGLFRHVCDLITSQAAMGCEIGLICDSATGGDAAETKLGDLAQHCKLGVNRMAISTMPGLGDVKSIAAVSRFAKASGAELIHGHGAKGGLYARLAAKRLNLPSVYTPHGGSLHYDWAKPPGFIFLSVEKLLRVPRSGVIFVCEYERHLFDRKIGLGKLPSAVIYNGLWPEEFAPRELKPAATDLLFVGEMRKLKGLDVLLTALSILPLARRPTATLVGEGRDLESFKRLSADLGLSATTHFTGRLPMKTAMPLGRIMVMPSRNESFPYVVLEAVAAGIPMITSNVGGIAEILPHDWLVPADNPAALAAAMAVAMDHPDRLHLRVLELQSTAKEKFSTTRMATETLAFYRQLL